MRIHMIVFGNMLPVVSKLHSKLSSINSFDLINNVTMRTNTLFGLNYLLVS